MKPQDHTCSWRGRWEGEEDRGRVLGDLLHCRDSERRRDSIWSTKGLPKCSAHTGDASGRPGPQGSSAKERFGVRRSQGRGSTWCLEIAAFHMQFLGGAWERVRAAQSRPAPPPHLRKPPRSGAEGAGARPGGLGTPWHLRRPRPCRSAPSRPDGKWGAMGSSKGRKLRGLSPQDALPEREMSHSLFH